MSITTTELSFVLTTWIAHRAHFAQELPLAHTRLLNSPGPARSHRTKPHLHRRTPTRRPHAKCIALYSHHHHRFTTQLNTTPHHDVHHHTSCAPLTCTTHHHHHPRATTTKRHHLSPRLPRTMQDEHDAHRINTRRTSSTHHHDDRSRRTCTRRRRRTKSTSTPRNADTDD